MKQLRCDYAKVNCGFTKYEELFKRFPNGIKRLEHQCQNFLAMPKLLNNYFGICKVVEQTSDTKLPKKVEEIEFLKSSKRLIDDTEYISWLTERKQCRCNHNQDTPAQHRQHAAQGLSRIVNHVILDRKLFNFFLTENCKCVGRKTRLFILLNQ